MTRLTDTLSAARRRLVPVLLAATLAAQALPARANLCDAAADRVARESAVPVSVLRALTRVETGRSRGGRLEPWPWTVNMEGEGRWFDSRAAALDYARRQRDKGARSFDTGCFQINYRWHGNAFRSLEQMFDPLENARYAAAFLKRLHAETGSWNQAAGAFHSRTPQHALRYRTKFERIHQSLTTPAPRRLAETPPPPATDDGASGQNGFALLQPAQGRPAHGSLVALPEAPAQALIRLDRRAEAL